MKRTTIIVMIITIIAKVFGFVRDKVVGYMFGPGAISDAFTMSYSIPSTIFTVVTAALVTGFIPMYSRVLNEDKEHADRFVSNIFNILVLLAFVLGIAMAIVPGVFVKFAASGFDEETFTIATQFVRIISFTVIAIAITQLGTGYLNVNQSFVIPNLLPIPGNIIIIASTFFAAKTGMTWLMGVGMLSGYIVQGSLMFFFMKKHGFKNRLLFDFKDEYLIKMVKLAVPLILSTMVITLNDTLMKSYGTTIADSGSYSYLSWSARLMGFATGIFVTGTLSVAYPTIANAASKNDVKKVVSSMNDAILLITLFILPASVGFLFLSYEIVSFVYGGGKVGPEELIILSDVFKGYAIALMAFGLKDLFTRIHYAYQDMKTPLRSNILYAVVNIAAYLTLGRILGLPGLTYAYAIANLVSVVFLFNSLLGRFKNLHMSTIVRDLAKIAIASALMGVSILVLNPVLSGIFSARLSLVVMISIAVGVYGLAILLLRVDAVMSILKLKTK